MEVVLRPLEPNDLPFLYRWENDAASWADSDTHNPLSQHQLRQYIADATGDIYRDGQLRLIILADGATVGCIDLFDLDPRNRRAAIGMYIDPSSRHGGIGRRALAALEQYAFTHLDLRLIYAVISSRNEACTALFRSMGYWMSSPLMAWTLEADAHIFIKQSSK